MKVNIIQSNGKRYLSEFPEFAEGLPFGILNKKITDAGGSFTALSCKDINYIIVVPYKDLVDSLVNDKNSPYKVFGIYGGVQYMDFKEYLLNNNIHKIVVTYDSFPKVIEWIKRNNFELNNYKLLVDEFHLILEDMGFRYRAIDTLMSNVRYFNHYTFMSATPINEEFLTSMFKELPYTEIEWNTLRYIRPVKISTTNVYTATVKLINKFLNNDLVLEDKNGNNTKVEELYIFLNSVVGIKQIIQSSDIEEEDIKIVCADTIRNKYTMSNLVINKITDPNAKINFFTKKGFQGCNLFSNNGLVVVLSDGKKANTIVDIETTLYQIAGRLRTNKDFDNVFKHIIWHIYSERKNVKSAKDFEEYMIKNTEESQTVINSFNKLNKEEREVYAKRVDIDDLVCYYDKEDDKFLYSELKEKYFRYNFKLVEFIYSNGLNIRESYLKSGYSPKEYKMGKLEETLLKTITKVGFKELLQKYIELREEPGTSEVLILIDQFNREHPLFKEAYDKLGKAGINTCSFVEKRIKEKLYATDDKTLDVVYRNFYDKVGENIFISNKKAKDLLIEIYAKFKITSFKPTVSMLKNCTWFEVNYMSNRINNVKTVGITLKKIK